MSIPEEVEELLEDKGIFVPNDVREVVDGDEAEAGSVPYIYQRALKGYCMCCDGELGKDTLIVVGAPFTDAVVEETHVVLVFCSGACMTDMHVKGWLQQKYDDIQQQVEFRGGAGGN